MLASARARLVRITEYDRYLEMVNDAQLDLWWRFCELKGRAYVCQREGVVYRDNLNVKSIALVHESCVANARMWSRFLFLSDEKTVE